VSPLCSSDLKKIIDKFGIAYLGFEIRFLFPNILNDAVNTMTDLDDGA